MNSSSAKKVFGQGQLTQTGDERDELQPLSKRKPWDLDIARVFGLFHDENLEWAIVGLHGGFLIFPLSRPRRSARDVTNSPGPTFR